MVSYPALQETFAERDAVRLMALFADIALQSPLAGPLAGTLLLRALSWRELFVAIGAVGALVTLGLWRCMPETARAAPPPRPPRAWAVLAHYATQPRHRDSVYGSLTLGLLPLPPIVWIGLPPRLIRDPGYGGLAYGLWQLSVFGAVIAGNLALNRLTVRPDVSRLLRIALYPATAGLLLLGAVVPLSHTLPLLRAGLSVHPFGVGLGNATPYRLTLYSTDEATGSVAAPLGMPSVAMPAAGGAALAWVRAGDSPTRFGISVSLVSLLVSLLAAPLLWRVLRQARPAPTVARFPPSPLPLS
ncbi:hypothetical protein [Burkholderia savannae]|uniref:hypothetical protein n=1 Tax=Burkholderia savannae TaxID=1637837 RepID=UPI000B01BBDA|nr:hypothetical protein [Burkholderia savannae]